MKKVYLILLALCLTLTMTCPIFAAAEDETAADTPEVIENMNPDEYGLHVEADGTITLEGKPFYGYGVNYFGAFSHYIDGSRADAQIFRDGFAGLAEHGIPFVRIGLGYWPTFYDTFDGDPEGVLAMLGEVLDAAQENHIGVIVSLFWYDASLPEHVGEHRADMGREDSRTVAYAKSFTEQVVRAFAGHRAVWGWEIGNEYNLGADLCDPELKSFLPGGGPGYADDAPVYEDYYTSDEAAYFMSVVAETIRRYDPYRLISSGCSEMRNAAWSMHMASSSADAQHKWNIDWTSDTRAKFKKAIKLYTPDPVDTVSFHFQSGTSGVTPASYVTEYVGFAGKGSLSVLDRLNAYVEAAQNAGKALYLGEFGDFLDMESAEDCPDMFRTLCGWIRESGIQIASLWQFQDYTDSGVAAAKLDILAELNDGLREEGLLYTDVAWGLAEDTSETDTSTEPDTEEPTMESPTASETTDAETMESEPADAGTTESGAGEDTVPDTMDAGTAESETAEVTSPETADTEAGETVADDTTSPDTETSDMTESAVTTPTTDTTATTTTAATGDDGCGSSVSLTAPIVGAGAALLLRKRKKH